MRPDSVRGASVRRLRFADLAGWEDDDHGAALRAFRRSARRHLERPFRSRPLSPLDGFERAARAALEGDDEPWDFFERHFTPHALGRGRLTAYYRPRLPASRERAPGFETPLHARPPDLVNLRGPDMRYGRIVDGLPHPYHDRAAIQGGALDSMGLEIAWLRDPVDAFVAHVQGSARLDMTDGTSLDVTYAAKSGHPYTSLGAVLLRRLRERDPSTRPGDVTADRLSEWMRALPRAELDAFLALNRSYIFFAVVPPVPGYGPDVGPVAAAKVPLITERSLAVDRTLHSFGLPFWIAPDDPLPGEDRPLRLLTVAHDTGSAIVGPARGDLYLGSGDAAGRRAAAVNHDTAFAVLLPNAAA